MSANWDYAQLAKVASQNGGPQKYLDDLKAGSKFEGRAQGVVVGLAVGGAVAVKGYDYWKKRKETAAAAERALLEGMQAEREGDDPAPDADEVV